LNRITNIITKVFKIIHNFLDPLYEKYGVVLFKAERCKDIEMFKIYLWGKI